MEFLIDSGAVYSVVPGLVLKKLKIEPLSKPRFRLSNGRKVVRRMGAAVFRYAEGVGGANVIFGEKGDMALLGWTTLSAMGLFLDPLKRELKNLPLLLA